MKEECLVPFVYTGEEEEESKKKENDSFPFLNTVSNFCKTKMLLEVRFALRCAVHVLEMKDTCTCTLLNAPYM